MPEQTPEVLDAKDQDSTSSADAATVRLLPDCDADRQRYPGILVDKATAELSGQERGFPLTISKEGVPVSAAVAARIREVLDERQAALAECCALQLDAVREQFGGELPPGVEETLCTRYTEEPILLLAEGEQLEGVN